MTKFVARISVSVIAAVLLITATMSQAGYAEIASRPGFFGKCIGFLSSAYKVRRQLQYVEDQKIWKGLGKDENVIVYGYLDNSDLMKAIRAEVKKGRSETQIYEAGGRIEDIARKSGSRFHKLSQTAREENSNYDWSFRFNYTIHGASLLIRLEGPKSVVQSVLKKVKPNLTWLGDNADVLPGNSWEAPLSETIGRIDTGYQTMVIYPGAFEGIQVGTAEFVHVASSEKVAVRILNVETMPFNDLPAGYSRKVDPAFDQGILYQILNASLPDGVAEMQPDSPVTVVHLQLR